MIIGHFKVMGSAAECIEGEQFKEAALTFFGTLKASGLRDEAILGIMRSSEPFMSRWDDTLDALGIEEQ